MQSILDISLTEVSIHYLDCSEVMSSILNLS